MKHWELPGLPLLSCVRIVPAPVWTFRLLPVGSAELGVALAQGAGRVYPFCSWWSPG